MKKTFLEKITGTSLRDDDTDGERLDDEYQDGNIISDDGEFESDDSVGELSVDMYQVEGVLVIKAMIAGIKKSDIQISLTRDRLIITGERYDTTHDAISKEYYLQELFWGKFERIIELPEEISIDEAEAHESHGLLVLILPLFQKDRRTDLKIG